jgi:methionyl-tRNA formyltransferase
MRLVYFASETFSIPALISLVNSDHDILAVVTRQNQEAHQTLDSDISVPIEAKNFNIPLLISGTIDDSDIMEKVQDLKADLGIISAFGEELPEILMSAFPVGLIQVHPALLLKHRGPDPIGWAIHNKERKTGVTVFRVTSEPYAGPILVQRETMIKPGETLAELEFRLARIACDALDATLKMLQ